MTHTELTVKALTLPVLLDICAKEYGDEIFLVFNTQKINYIYVVYICRIYFASHRTFTTLAFYCTKTIDNTEL
jgi:hypothetical protein